jgi:hypothetical protein
MSASADRSFESITRDDLSQLAQLALSCFEDFFACNPEHPYRGRLRLICLVQGGAKHYVDPDLQIEPNQRWGGVNDFDVCGFFQAVPGRSLFARRRCELDFSPDSGGSGRFKGRRVDAMWRSLDVQVSEAPIEAVQRYLRCSRPNTSARYWAGRPVVVIWPSEDLGRIIWPTPSVVLPSKSDRDGSGPDVRNVRSNPV